MTQNCVYEISRKVRNFTVTRPVLTKMRLQWLDHRLTSAKVEAMRNTTRIHNYIAGKRI